MNDTTKTIPLDEALEAAIGARARLALLHIAFSKVLMAEFGEERGKELITKAIIDYGHRIAERVEKGLPDLTELGLFEEKGKTKNGKTFVRGCTLCKVFKQQDALDVGHMYCYVDAAKSMALNPEEKMIHTSCEACGDEICVFDIVPTTEEERNAFADADGSWQAVDPRLLEFTQ
jgi:predicted hydrocarbon binding protein